MIDDTNSMNQFEGEPVNRPLRRDAADTPLTCVHCGGAIVAGELFLPAGRCAMGGVVTGPAVALYSDVLEPAGEHLRCAVKSGGDV